MLFREIYAMHLRKKIIHYFIILYNIKINYCD
jgi:hypothetical protein